MSRIRITSIPTRRPIVGRRPFRRSIVRAALPLALAALAASSASAIQPGDLLVANPGALARYNQLVHVDAITGKARVVSQDGLNRIDGVAAVDSDTAYVSDRDAPQIFRVDLADGDVSIVESFGFLSEPRSMEADDDGTILIADRCADGISRSFADPPADCSTGAVLRYDPVADVVSVVSAGGQLEEPTDVARGDDGFLYVADRDAGIVRVDPINGAQALVTAGTLFSVADGIAVEADGNLIVIAQVGFFDNGVLRVDPSTGAETLISQADAGLPSGVAVGLDGRILVADIDVEGVVSVDPSTGDRTMLAQGVVLSFPAGIARVPGTPSPTGRTEVSTQYLTLGPVPAGGSAPTATITISNPGDADLTIDALATRFPSTAALDPGDLLVANPDTDDKNQLMRVSRRDRGVEILSQGHPNRITGVAVGLDGQVFVTDREAPQFHVVDPLVGQVTVVDSFGLLSEPQGIAVDGDGRLLIADRCADGVSRGIGDPPPDCSTGALLRYDPATDTTSLISTNGLLEDPVDVAVSPDGTYFVADDALVSIGGFFGLQTLVHSGAGLFTSLNAISLEPGGTLVAVGGVANSFDEGVFRIDPQTGVGVVLSQGGLLQIPTGLAVDRTGAIYVAETSIDGVLRIDPVTGDQRVVTQSELMRLSAHLDVVPGRLGDNVPECAPFALSSSPLPITLAPGESTTVDVDFTAPAVGRFACNLDVVTDDVREPVVEIRLRGRGN